MTDEPYGRRPRVAAIIPAYNEEPTIAGVVAVAVESPLIDEVIVVSDGSSDRTAEMAREAGATIVRELPVTSGKGAAMLHGVTNTDAPILVFLDADLIGLRLDHLERLILPVLSGAKTMNVLLRDRGPIITRLMRHLPLIGGERALPRFVIEKIPPEYVQGFMVEAALNYYCRSHRLRYGSVAAPGLKIRHKYEKVGMKAAMWQYIHMSYQGIWAMIAVRLARLFGRF